MISKLVDAVDAALTVLTRRVLTLVALVMAFALFLWAMYSGTWVQLAVAGAFAALIFLPVLARDERPEERWKQEPPQS
jgi:hypothetical protein